MQTARSGPPWCWRSLCASPSSPSAVTRAAGTAVFGTPPRDTLIWTILASTCEPPSGKSLRAQLYASAVTGPARGRARGSAPGAADHPLHARLEHLFAPLVEDAVPIGDDAAVGLLRLALVGNLDLDRERVALEHRRRH